MQKIYNTQEEVLRYLETRDLILAPFSRLGVVLHHAPLVPARVARTSHRSTCDIKHIM